MLIWHCPLSLRLNLFGLLLLLLQADLRNFSISEELLKFLFQSPISSVICDSKLFSKLFGSHNRLWCYQLKRQPILLGSSLRLAPKQRDRRRYPTTRCPKPTKSAFISRLPTHEIEKYKAPTPIKLGTHPSWMRT